MRSPLPSSIGSSVSTTGGFSNRRTREWHVKARFSPSSPENVTQVLKSDLLAYIMENHSENRTCQRRPRHTRCHAAPTAIRVDCDCCTQDLFTFPTRSTEKQQHLL